MSDTRRHVHQLVDRLPPAQLEAVAGLLESMIAPEEDRDTLSHAERRPSPKPMNGSNTTSLSRTRKSSPSLA
jgi:hypothetical protein